MNDKTKLVYNGWLMLDSSERDAFDKAVSEYKLSPESKKIQIKKTAHEARDAVMKMQTGPLGRGTCACCGR